MRLWLTWFGAEMDSWLIFLGLKNEISPKDFPQTLLFIDEIQESEKAISFLRYFYEDLPELNVIAAGSLLEHTLKKTKII